MHQAYEFPEYSKDLASNFCRRPSQDNSINYVGCYSNDLEYSFRSCNLPQCKDGK